MDVFKLHYLNCFYIKIIYLLNLDELIIYDQVNLGWDQTESFLKK